MGQGFSLSCKCLSFLVLQLLEKIVLRKNRYTIAVDGHGKTKGGPKWYNSMMQQLKAFVALFLFMGLKKKTNHKSCWMKVGSVSFAS
jgi:hypothetical protein